MQQIYHNCSTINQGKHKNLRHGSPYAFGAALYASWNWGKIHKSTAADNHCILVGKVRSTMSQSHIFQAQWWLYFLLLWIPHAHVSWQHQAPHGPKNLRMISSNYKMQNLNSALMDLHTSEVHKNYTLTVSSLLCALLRQLNHEILHGKSYCGHK